MKKGIIDAPGYSGSQASQHMLRVSVLKIKNLYQRTMHEASVQAVRGASRLYTKNARTSRENPR